MDRHGGLAVLIGREFLRFCDRDRGVAIDYFLNNPSHGLDTERERNDIQQEGIGADRQRPGLQGCPKCHHLIGIDVRQRWLAEQGSDFGTHQGGPGRSANQNHAGHCGQRDPGIIQHICGNGDGTVNERGDQPFHGCAVKVMRDPLTGDLGPPTTRILGRQTFLGKPRHMHQG